MKARIPGAQNQGNMMKKIQQMQEDMTRIQEEIEATEYTSSVGGGAVEVTVNGSHEVLSIKMQPDVVDPEDIEMLEDLLISALNESIKKANDAMDQGMEKAKGLAGKGHLFDMVDNINNNNSSEVLSIIDKLHGESCDMERLCAELINHYRTLMMIKTVKEPQKLIVCTDHDLELYKKQADKTNLYKILNCISLLEEASTVLKTSSSKRTEMELTAVKMTVPNISNDNTAVMSRIDNLERIIKSGKFSAEKPTESFKEEVKTSQPIIQEKASESSDTPPEIHSDLPTNETPNDTEEDTLFNQWGEVLSLLDVSDKPLTGILGASMAYVRGDFILIKCDNPVFSQFIRQSNHSMAIRKAIFDVTGRKYRLGIYKSNDNQPTNKDPLADLIKKINR